MSISRVRVEAEGRNHQEVMDDLNHAFGLIFESRMIPHDTEFVEEVVETHIRNDGAIEYHGRRVIRFYEGGPDENELAILPENPDPNSPPPFLASSWVVSGNATTATNPLTTSIFSVASNAASSVSVSPGTNWSVYDAVGSSVPNDLTVEQASQSFCQPFYFHGRAGHGG